MKLPLTSKKIPGLLLAATATFGACGGGSATTTKTTSALCTSLPPLKMKASYRVGFSQLWEPAGNPWREGNTASMMSEAAKRGYELVYNPGKSADAGEQVANVQALIDAKVDAIFVAPHDETILAPSVVAARKACIPVFVVDRAVNTSIAVPGTDYVTYLGSDFKHEGELTADWLVKKTGGAAKIIELEGTVGSSPAIQRKQGFDAHVAAQAGMSILVSQSGDFNQQKGHDLIAKLLPANPTANVIYAHNDMMALGVLDYFREMNITPGKDITIISIDGTKMGTQEIINGNIAEITECSPKYGPVAFDALEKYARGETLPIEIKNVDRVFDSTNAAAYLPEAF